MKDLTVDGKHPLVVAATVVNQSHQRGIDDAVSSPTVVSCDAATVASDETTTNENGNCGGGGGATTTFTSSSTTSCSSSNSSEAAVIVEHRSWTTRNMPKRIEDDTIPKAITLTTTTAVPTYRTHYSSCEDSPSSISFSMHTSSITNASTAELYQQLQKRLRPEDIPSIPTLSSRNQRRRYSRSVSTAPTIAAIPMITRDSCYRPICNFINYMGNTTRRTIPDTTGTYFSNTAVATHRTLSSCYHSRLGKFPKSLITLHDDNEIDDARIGDLQDLYHLAAIDPTIDDDGGGGDMLLLSTLDMLDWGVVSTDGVEGMEIDYSDENDAFLLHHHESQEAEMVRTIGDHEPYRFTNTCSVPIVVGSTAATKMKHLDQLETLIDHSSDRTLFDSFTLPQYHDDATDLFVFDL